MSKNLFNAKKAMFGAVWWGVFGSFLSFENVAFHWGLIRFSLG